jgi:hypothetical protein
MPSHGRDRETPLLGRTEFLVDRPSFHLQITQCSDVYYLKRAYLHGIQTTQYLLYERIGKPLRAVQG